VKPLNRILTQALAIGVFGACVGGLLVGCDGRHEKAAPRVVSLTPIGTRALHALGVSDRIVAADETSRTRLGTDVAAASLRDVLDHHPDLVLVGLVEPADEALVETIRQHGPAVIEVAPHQMTDALALYEELGLALGDPSRGHRTANRIGDPFAAVSVRQLGRTRPRVAVVVDLDPFTLAGGHSFESDLVEIAGGESITHGGGESRIEWPIRDVHRAEPDLVIVATAEPMSDSRRADVAATLVRLPVRFTVLETDALWLEDARATLETWVSMVETARDPPSEN